MARIDQQAAQSLLQARRLLTQGSIRRARRNIRPTRVRPPSGARLLYLKDLLIIQRALEQAIRDDVFTILPDLVMLGRIVRPDGQAERIDAPPSEIIGTVIEGLRIGLFKRFIPRDLDAIAENVGATVNLHNQKGVDRAIKSVLGISLSAAEPWMADLMAAFRKENVSLIKSLMGNQLDQIEQLLIRGQRKGLQVDVLRSQIQDRFKVSKSKARLLARDQTNKLNGEMLQLRQESLGVKKYIWRTSGDDRVRETHQDLEGTTQSWDSPPEVAPGRYEHPGGDYQCRCWAEPILEPIVEGLRVQPPRPVARAAR